MGHSPWNCRESDITEETQHVHPIMKGWEAGEGWEGASEMNLKL